MMGEITKEKERKTEGTLQCVYVCWYKVEKGTVMEQMRERRKERKAKEGKDRVRRPKMKREKINERESHSRS